MKIGLGVALAFMTPAQAAEADNFKLSNNQRIACSRGLSAGKLNTSTCKSYAYVFNTKTSEYFRCQVSMALTRDNKEVINSTELRLHQEAAHLRCRFKLFVRRHGNRAAEHQFVLRSRRLCGLGQRQQ